MISIALLYPELLGTYGDGGNALALQERLVRRGIEATTTRVSLGDALPSADLYLLGGGEDGPQRFATELLREADFAGRIRNGAHVFAVCAGLQILGDHFAVEGEQTYAGLGAVDVASRRGTQRRVGNLLLSVEGRDVVGFENHGGETTLGVSARAFGSVRVGFGNDGVSDGYCQFNVTATYAHGPVLAMNPWLADSLLERVTGQILQPLPSVADELYEHRRTILSR
jgi:CobQ-like glutamine amidotransferase family enzyme